MSATQMTHFSHENDAPHGSLQWLKLWKEIAHEKLYQVQVSPGHGPAGSVAMMTFSRFRKGL